MSKLELHGAVVAAIFFLGLVVAAPAVAAERSSDSVSSQKVSAEVLGLG